MEQLLEGTSSGPSRIPLGNNVINHWKTPFGYVSSDASLFSSSVPVLSHEKLAFNESIAMDDNFPSLSKLRLSENKDPIERNNIGFLLPGDEEELLAGVTDDFDLSGLPTQLEDLEDDLFGSGGGFELESDGKFSLSEGISGTSLGPYAFQNGGGAVSGEHPFGEHPSRTLFVRNINSNVEDSELQALFEQYGDIRTLYTACKHRGFVMISYYDIRSARTAMRALQSKPLRRRKLDIHFSIPKDNPSEKDINQGTLVVFNLDPSVSNEDLRLIFGVYGEVKEIRETPHKRHHKFIEFYDVRGAEAALKALNRSDIAGKRIKLEPSRPGGARRSLMQQLSQELEREEARPFLHQVGSPITNSPPTTWPSFNSPVNHSPGLPSFSPNHLPGLASILPSSPAKIAPIGKERVGTSFQETKLSPGSSNSNSSGIGTLSGPQYLWGSPTIHSEHTNSSAWSSSLRSNPYQTQTQSNGYKYTNLMNPHHGSAPTGSSLERHFGFFPESSETSSYVNHHQVSFRGPSPRVMNMGPGPGPQGVMNMGVAFAGNYTENGSSPSSRMMPVSRNGTMYFGNGSYGGGINHDGLNDRVRTRRVESGTQVDNKKQYQLDLDKIRRGEDNRTTLMIKNIPNKYTSKMLLTAIDETHNGSYDFIYLPIDFKNKCNVGYAFINMVSPSHIITFYEAFNGKKWEKFNSEKVASLAYGRIQGKTALVAHFQNSSLMNEDKRCRPILFHSEGQGINDQDALLSSNLNICIRQPDGSYSGDALDSPKENVEGILFTGFN